MKQSDIDEVYTAIERDDLVGVCLNPNCNDVTFGTCEPDAYAYHCDECGQSNVVGQEGFLFAMLAGEIAVEPDVPDEPEHTRARAEIASEVIGTEIGLSRATVGQRYRASAHHRLPRLNPGLGQ